MSLFSLGTRKNKYGIVIDIGSGSVLTAIVHSVQNEKYPTIIWAHREHSALKQISSIEQSAKAVLAALMNASLKLDQEGRRALREYDSKARLTTLQCSIAAPWSYTVTKTINVKHDTLMEITDSLIDELTFSAQKQVEEELNEQAATNSFGLEVITKATMDLLTNGYRVTNPDGERAQALVLTQATVVAQKNLSNGLLEMKQKLFPNATLERVSFILMLYCGVRHLYQNLDDVCLVDVTDEATEIGIVRDGSLRFSTHMSFGMFSLARELSAITNIPLTEALGHLRMKDIASIRTLFPESTHEDIDSLFTAYINKLATLFNETGDTLSIPKQIMLHIEDSFQPLFSYLLKKATHQATKIEHSILLMSDSINSQEQRERHVELIGDYTHDTSLFLHAEFFHKREHCLGFIYS